MPGTSASGSLPQAQADVEPSRAAGVSSPAGRVQRPSCASVRCGTAEESAVAVAGDGDCERPVLLRVRD
jgi:hypothetical protein